MLRHGEAWAFALLWAVLAAPRPVMAALSPLYGFQGLVAGGYPGDADGAFDQARFKDPQGLAFDARAERLYVADRGNSSIRVVELSHRNAVETLGRGLPFDFGGAPLRSPTALAWVEPGKLLAVLDCAAPALIVLDLEQRRVADRWQPQEAGEAAFLRNATDLEAGANWLALSASLPPRVGALSWQAGKLALKRIWDVQGAIVEGALNGLWVGDPMLALTGQGPNGRMVRLVDPGTGPLRAANFGADTPLPLSISAEAVAEQPEWPVAFVKETVSAALVCRSPELAVMVHMEGPVATLRKLGVYDGDDRLIGRKNTAVLSQRGLPADVPDTSLVNRRWLNQPGRAAGDAETCTWYISDPENGRVLYFRPFQAPERGYDAGNPKGFIDYDFPAARRSYLRRAVIAGTSMCYYPADTALRSHSLARRLEDHLNHEASLRGAAKGYEVIFCGAPLGFGQGGLNTLGQLRVRWDQIIDDYSPDLLFVMVLPNDLFLTALTYNYRALDDAGLPSVKFDSEYALRGPDPARQPKAMAELKRVIKRLGNGLLTVSDNGVIVARHDLSNATAGFAIGNAELRKLMWSLMQPYFQDIRARADKAAVKMGHPLKVQLVYFPSAGVIASEETNGDIGHIDTEPLEGLLKGEAARLGFEWLDVNADVRVDAPQAPFLYEDHFVARGFDHLASIMARRLFDAAGPDSQP